MLLGKGADPNAVSSFGTPLLYALRNPNASNTEILAALCELLDRGVDINAIGAEGTALHMALQFKPSKSQLMLVKELLRRGADINVVCRARKDSTAACSPGWYE